jgi:hypothetical protein
MRVEMVSQGPNLDFEPPMDGIAQENRVELVLVCLRIFTNEEGKTGCRYIRTSFGKHLPRNLKFSVRLYRAFVFKILHISGVNLDFRGVKKRKGGGERNFPIKLVACSSLPI